MTVKTQIQLDIDDNFVVTGARIKELGKDTNFVEMSPGIAASPNHPDKPPRDDMSGSNRNKRIVVPIIRTGTGTCKWVQLANGSWVQRCT